MKTILIKYKKMFLVLILLEFLPLDIKLPTTSPVQFWSIFATTEYTWHFHNKNKNNNNNKKNKFMPLILLGKPSFNRMLCLRSSRKNQPHQAVKNTCTHVNTKNTKSRAQSKGEQQCTIMLLTKTGYISQARFK